MASAPTLISDIWNPSSPSGQITAGGSPKKGANITWHHHVSPRKEQISSGITTYHQERSKYHVASPRITKKGANITWHHHVSPRKVQISRVITTYHQERSKYHVASLRITKKGANITWHHHVSPRNEPISRGLTMSHQDYHVVFE